jgi:hypothetical protein
VIYVFSKRIFGSMNILYEKIKLLSQQHKNQIRAMNSEYDPLDMCEEDDEFMEFGGTLNQPRRGSWNRRYRVMRRNMLLANGAEGSSQGGLDVTQVC